MKSFYQYIRQRSRAGKILELRCSILKIILFSISLEYHGNGNLHVKIFAVWIFHNRWSPPFSSEITFELLECKKIVWSLRLHDMTSDSDRLIVEKKMGKRLIFQRFLVVLNKNKLRQKTMFSSHIFLCVRSAALIFVFSHCLRLVVFVFSHKCEIIFQLAYDMLFFVRLEIDFSVLLKTC